MTQNDIEQTLDRMEVLETTINLLVKQQDLLFKVIEILINKQEVTLHG